VYTTREAIKRALQIGETAENDQEIDRCIASTARIIDGYCHRTFYPMTATRKFDWPSIQGALPWRLWVDDCDVISVSAISSTGGGAIPVGNIFLENNRTGPPYDRIELNLSSASAFGGGNTYQQSILVTGLFGYSNNETAVGTVIEALDASETAIDVDAATSSMVGVGSILRFDDERVIVTERDFLTTGATLAGNLDGQQKTVTVPVSNGALFARGEVVVLDSESVLVLRVVGNNLTVRRAYDGSVIAAHTSGITIYGPRTLSVQRGALGTTAAVHLTGSTVNRWDPPPGPRQLNNAMAISDLMQEKTGWFRTMSASSNFGGTSRRSATMESIIDLRQQVTQQYGRKARQRTI